jgi:hypothetical protein
MSALTALLIDGSLVLAFQAIPLAGAAYVERRYAPREPSGDCRPQPLPEGSPMQTRENEPLAG